jgi:hypothetical protein
MLPYSFYKVVHIFGLLLAYAAVGGVAVHAANGGTKAASVTRRLTAVLHGAGAFLVLLGGFGMLARLGIVQGASFPGWLWAKLAIWVVIAVVVVLPYRRPSLAVPVLGGLPFLGALAAYLAVYKPF